LTRYERFLRPCVARFAAQHRDPESTISVIRRRVLVSGRVQGVGFRMWVSERARSRHVSGWVRNLADGDVEAVFEGEPEAVAALVDWCRRGPRGAGVRDVQVADEPPAGEAGFRSLP
jgi:acylphosphatase